MRLGRDVASLPEKRYVWHMAGQIHLLRERKGKDVTSKCGQSVSIGHTTIWHRDVTCILCLGLMAGERGGEHRVTI